MFTKSRCISQHTLLVCFSAADGKQKETITELSSRKQDVHFFFSRYEHARKLSKLNIMHVLLIVTYQDVKFVPNI